MTYCVDFFRKFKKEGNFCGLDKSQVSRLEAYLDIVELLIKQKIPEDQIYENFTVHAARPLLTAKDKDRTDGLNYVTACLKRGEKITTGDLQSSIQSFGSANPRPKKSWRSPTPKTESKPETKPPLLVEKPQETTAPPAPFAAAMKAKFTQPENKPAPVAPVTTGQVIQPEHAVILSVAYCQAKKCEHLLPCKERGGRIECFPAGAEPRHMNECPIEKRKRIAQEQGFGTAADYDPTNGAKFIKHPPYKIIKAPEIIHFEPAKQQWEFINRMIKSGEFETPEQVVSGALDRAMEES